MLRTMLRYLLLSCLGMVLFAEGVQAAEQTAPPPAPAMAKPSVAPIANPKWNHAPFESGECSICHEKNDPKAPGPVNGPIPGLCYGCHDQVKAAQDGSVTQHPPVQQNCTFCHNPHNSIEPNGLIKAVPGLCLSCHSAIDKLMQSAKVQHGALTQGASCINCHQPHGSKVEKLLAQLPYDLCVNCHSKDGMKDEQGKALTNFKKLLETKKVIHPPVAAKDCSACHQTHGGEHFRMLVADYPAKFYAPYDPKNYELCFMCHDDEMVAQPNTTALTGFRDGTKNLHYFHVNRTYSGRTCRACHEVHAAENAHIIRNATPYGAKGWMLQLNFQQTPTGGQCSKTCHSTRTYDRTKKN